ncbi:hypothetical protein VTI74DRAFT_4070 [Chaetomium olivicolor]
MATYTEEQLDRYLKHIRFPQVHVRRDVSRDPLGFLTALQVHHMARVPFESLSLHYSKHRLLSLDPEDLFEKIVESGRGGYCMEVNTLFAAVLRSLGYTLYSAGARVKGPNGYKGWDHMVNIVTIGSTRYLVDVGFGSNGSASPQPLDNDREFDAVPPVVGRLQYRKLDEHTDPNQRAWLYSVKENEDAPWKDMYSFVETEFMPGDFEVMNLRTMTTPQSFFVQSVMCIRTIPDAAMKKPIGWLILYRDYVKKRVGSESKIIEQLENEEQRVEALERHFGIVLSEVEKKGIRGLSSELRPKGGHA